MGRLKAPMKIAVGVLFIENSLALHCSRYYTSSRADAR
jgi:hypothetical protein